MPRPRPLRSIEVRGTGIEIRPFKDLGFRPQHVIVGISSEGIVGPLAASHLVEEYAMDQVCALESSLFPPISAVYFGKPKFPARIYASRKHKVAIVLAEFEPDDGLARPLAHTILAWSRLVRAGQVLAIEGFRAEPGTSHPVGVVAVGSHDEDRAAIKAAKLDQMRHGPVLGVAGVLLNEGRWIGRRTIALTTILGGQWTEAEAASRVVEALRKLAPALAEPGPADAREPTQLERAIREARERTLAQEYI